VVSCVKKTLNVRSLSEILLVKMTDRPNKNIAQSVEHPPSMPKVVCSNPAGGYFSIGKFSSLVKYFKHPRKLSMEIFLRGLYRIKETWPLLKMGNENKAGESPVN